MTKLPHHPALEFAPCSSPINNRPACPSSDHPTGRPRRDQGPGRDGNPPRAFSRRSPRRARARRPGEEPRRVARIDDLCAIRPRRLARGRRGCRRRRRQGKDPPLHVAARVRLRPCEVRRAGGVTLGEV